MGSVCELPRNVVRIDKSKMLIDLNQKVSGTEIGASFSPIADENSTGEEAVPNPSLGK